MDRYPRNSVSYTIMFDICFAEIKPTTVCVIGNFIHTHRKTQSIEMDHTEWVVVEFLKTEYHLKFLYVGLCIQYPIYWLMTLRTAVQK